MHTTAALLALGVRAPEPTITGQQANRFTERAAALHTAMTPSAPAAPIEKSAALQHDKTPLIDVATAFRMTAAACDRMPGDRALMQLRRVLADKQANEPLSTLSIKACQDITNTHRSRAVTALVDDFARRGFALVDVAKARVLAGHITDQASFDRVLVSAGAATNRPEHIQLRAAVAHIVNERAAGKDVFEPAISDHPDDAVQMPDDGAKAIKAGIQHLLAGKVLRGPYGFGRLAMHGDAEAVLTLGRKQLRVAMYQLDEAVRRLAQFNPDINEQQDSAVDIAVGEAGNVLGKDSSDDPGFKDPKVNVKAPKQTGTSTGVVAMVRCTSDGCNERRKLALQHTPAWVAQPPVWQLVTRQGGTYAAALTRYASECDILGLRGERRQAHAEVYPCPRCRKQAMVILAGGAETLGKDTTTDEVGWLPGGELKVHSSNPADQSGTSFADTNQAVEPDHETDVPAWTDPGEIETSRKGPKASKTAAIVSDINPQRRHRAYVDEMAAQPLSSMVRAVVASQTRDWREFQFRQEGDGQLVPEGVRYRFAFRASAGEPSTGDIQAFVSAHDSGDWLVRRADRIDSGVMEAILVKASVDPVNPYGESRSSKAARIKAAMRTSQMGELPMGGGGMADEPAGMGPDHAGAPGNMEAAKPAPAAPPAAPVVARRTAGITTGKVGARVNESWGENGTFDRAVEAESAAEMWELYQGLNGKEPKWPQTPAPPVVDKPPTPGKGPPAPEAAKGPQSKPKDPPAAGPIPSPPIPGPDGAEMPEPEPKVLEGDLEDPMMRATAGLLSADAENQEPNQQRSQLPGDVGSASRAGDAMERSTGAPPRSALHCAPAA